MELIKIQKIFNWFTPGNFKEIQKFLKFVNYNRQFVKKYLKILHFLTTSAKKNVLFKRNKNKIFFIQFKQVCDKYFVSCIYDFIKLLQLEMDINNFAMETCFTQKYDNKRHLIAYYSKKMLKIK